MKQVLLISVILTVLLFNACKKCEEPKQPVIVDNELLEKNIIADTIVYEVIIKSTSSSEEWMSQCQQFSEISHLNKTTFIDSLFADIYGNKYVVYDFFSGNPITTEELAAMEKEEWFSRDAIGKIQFKETWYFDREHQIFRKKVLSMVLGVELVDDLGALKGYKAIFKLNLK
jgi:hypothetical protein